MKKRLSIEDWQVVLVVSFKTEIQDSDLCGLIAGEKKVISGGKREISGAEPPLLMLRVESRKR